MMRTGNKVFVSQAAVRRLLSSATRTRNYLEAWVGSKPGTGKSDKSPSPSPSSVVSPRPSSRNDRPLLLSGSSYLMPTLRLERNDTPESLSARIATALEESPAPNAVIVKSMLCGKATADGTARWRVPIVLDLSALVPDGSPHYIKPPKGVLTAVVETLNDFGITVVGLSNPPPEMEDESVRQLGLPSVLSKSRALDRQMDATFRIEDVVQLVLSRVEDEAQHETSDSEAEEESLQKIKEDCSTSSLNGNESRAEATESTSEVLFSQPKEDNLNGMDGHDSSETTEPAETDKGGTIPSMEEPVQGGTRVYHGSVRSGQQIAADTNQSLIVIGSVNSGGEVLSDRDIFVFGKLRGRALAGLASGLNGGEKSARVFASSFDPELVCIGDTFTTVDNVRDFGLDRPGEAAMVSLNADGVLVFEYVPM